jgi:hypothetical protein
MANAELSRVPARLPTVIPLGTGIGKVWVLHSGTTINAFAEPQFSVVHGGTGQPHFQVFAGLNLQFPIGKK